MTILRNWIALDACGNESDCLQFISVIDSADPVISCPADITVACDESTEVSETGRATATDICDEDPEVTYQDSETRGSCVNEYVVDRVWTATDACGNSSLCTQIISVIDDVGPTLTCPPDVTVECDASTDVSATGMAAALDNCDPSPSITQSDSSTPGTCSQEMLVQRVWTASDRCGNQSVCTQRITVVDSIAPTLTCPESVTLECNGTTNPGFVAPATATR